MRVSDVYNDCLTVVPSSDPAIVYSRISDAVEVLANKGLIDAMQGYLEIPTTSSRIVTLPRDIETPVKVNVGDNPAFSRTKLYEFTMNGPGSNYSPTDWAWEDRGQVPVSRQPTTTAEVRIKSSSALDTSSVGSISITGRTGAISPDTVGQIVTDEIPLNGVSYATSEHDFSEIIRVVKPATSGSITLQSTYGPTTLSIYAPDEVEPSYRQIKLSQSGTTAHILYRRTVYRVTSQDDWIPCQSRMGLLTMLRANEMFRKATAADIQLGTMLEKQAEKFVEEEQKSRNMFADVAGATEKDSAHGLSLNNRDSAIVADIYDDVAKMLGPVSKSVIFDSITDALETLSNRGQWDGLEGYVDISTEGERYVTLPRDVDVPLAINIGCHPTQPKNRWFEFHLNGPGDRDLACRSWEDHGDVVTIHPIEVAQGLTYGCTAADVGKTITVYGYDENDRWIDGGLTLSAIDGGDEGDQSAQKVERIERIVREPTAGFCQLIAYDEDDEPTVIGYYYPDETEPRYRRIRLPVNTDWIRMRYKKRALKISSLTDNLNLRSRMAVLHMIASMAALRSDKPDFQLSQALEEKAVKLLNEEKESRNPVKNTGWLQVDTRTSFSSPEHGQY